MGSSPHLGLLLRPPNPALSLSLGHCFALQNPSFPCSSLEPSSFRRGWRGAKRPINSRPTWLCGYMRRSRVGSNWENQHRNEAVLLGSDGENGVQVPTQARSVVEGSNTVVVSEYKPIPDIDYLQELLAIQQQGPRVIGFFGTRNMGFMHQQLIEILSYAMVITKNQIFTSGASGTNAAVIRGALRAEKPELLTVILPQSLKMQPSESQELLSKVIDIFDTQINFSINYPNWLFAIWLSHQPRQIIHGMIIKRLKI
ncbi:uncharacterized protein LOC103715249 isoform X2 [Phoenix dactylifera]|uniref:Uncharacterized protein LOC103715249 isoform X2 n=1 Tax=Phoenix dactylifera TaxID=42345 RepID=A0A8B7CKH3_PHODC|nr:uncharacterized protein LOC103715249 isoform X2 [Phoenix dactylifera]